ncbi:MAG: phytanoyl-CoA dioxygenase family protein [Pseudomonadales bacterium]|nr:phytanoyl-CoA dioxygenase family protein [Pseudomonadales bacterium]MCP5184141.1 phytanoyl-CoA dioxygenase family protein [Pseudomonadales bacterium]
MIRRHRGYLAIRDGETPAESRELETDGYTVLRGVLSPADVASLRAELEVVYATVAADVRNPHLEPAEREDFRYAMFNRSPLAQATIANPRILEVIEPLLGDDCHVIANTCWRNPPRAANQHGGGFWHIDAGPHVPRPEGIPWDERIPYPVFAIGAHIYVKDCGIESGPTGVIPGSHRSGRFPPADRLDDVALTWEGRGVHAMEARAGDVALFVSDVWHRRLPSGEGDQGRFFLQAHYGRRDLAQRVLTTREVNHVSPQAIERAASARERRLLGLHDPFFYDG